MELEYELTMDDLIAFNRHAIAKSPTIRRAYRLSFFWVAAAALAVLIASGRRNPVAALVALVVVLALYAAWLRFACTRRIDRQVRRLMAEGENKTVLTRHLLRVGKDGLVDTTEAGEARAKWIAVERVAEDTGHVYLYVGAYLAHTVPKRAFRDEAEATQFVSTVTGY